VKIRNEGNRVGRPLFFDRSTTIIGRLGHHVETRNRKPAGTSMATCVLPICSARQRETSVILCFFQRTFVLHRYALSYPRIRAIPRTVEPSPSPPPLPPPSFIRSDIPRNLRRFCCASLSPRGTFCFRAASRCCFAFVSENCTIGFSPMKNGPRTRATKSGFDIF